MSEDYQDYEHEFDPMEDTHPTGTMPRVELDDTPPRWQRLVGLVSLVGAVIFTLGSIYILLTPEEPDGPVQTVRTDATAESTTAATNAPTDVAVTPPPDATSAEQEIDALPTLDPQMAETLLQEPLKPVEAAKIANVDQGRFNPFTIIPDRPRSEVITYTVERGDTIDEIAERFGLEPETIAWSNPRRIIQVLRPGDNLNIPPEDGVFITTHGSIRTIADYANQYQIEDPYLVIDSEYNNLDGFTPETVPPSGTQIFFPGGEAEEIVWVTEIEVSDSSGGTGSSAGQAMVMFNPSDPGTCGRQPIEGGTVWGNPLTGSSYTVTQGFSPIVHPGIDLAGVDGMPVKAANGGRVIFAGWSNFGYGYAVAIIHGPNMTVYGHLSQVNVGCGQTVGTGQVIGLMGSTGQSSGPHLHFEIRARQGGTYVPVSPYSTLAF